MGDGLQTVFGRHDRLFYAVYYGLMGDKELARSDK